MASNFLDFTDPNDPRFGIDNPYDLYQYYSNPSLTQQTEEENLAPPLTQQTVFNPLTNYFGDDDDEEDVINRNVNTNKNFNFVSFSIFSRFSNSHNNPSPICIFSSNCSFD